MRKYNSYKDSGIDWLGKIPSHWEIKALKRCAKICNGQDHKGVWDNNGEYPILGSGGVFGKSIQFLHRGPSVLLGRKGTIDKPRFVNEPFWTVDTAYYTDIQPNIHPRLFYFLTTTINFDLYKYGSAVPSMTQQDLGHIPFAISKDFQEQTQIASFLDKKTAQIDKLINEKEKLLKLLAEKRTAIITQAVTKGLPAEERAKAGLDPNVEIKDSGIDWLGKIPKHWNTLKLRYLGRMKSGDGITSLDIKKEGNYPVYGGNGLRGYYESYTHEGEYVLIGRQGALCGNINYVNGKFWASEHAVVVTKSDKVDLYWLGELLRIMNLNQYSVSAAQPGLAIDRIQNLYIPLPPLTEQIKISRFLKEKSIQSSVDSKIQESIYQLKEYREALITAAVTGQIDVRKEVINE